MADVVIKHAATVVLLRDGAAGRPEVLMVKRHRKSAFMGSAYVYPGGKLDDDDTTETALGFCQGLSPQQAAQMMAPVGTRDPEDEPITPAQAVGLFVAAIREVFEESGLLLADDEHGAQMDFTAPDVQERFANWRTQLQQGKASMTQMAQQEKLTYNLEGLVYFSHWITPPIEKRRFNTRFFLTRAPKGQTPLQDNHEVVDARWLTPKEALELGDSGKIMLAPPTARTLEDLSAFDTVDDALKAAATQPVITILPRFDSVDGEMTLFMPRDPRFAHPASVPGMTSMAMRDGRWRSVR